VTVFRVCHEFRGAALHGSGCVLSAATRRVPGKRNDVGACLSSLQAKKFVLEALRKTCELVEVNLISRAQAKELRSTPLPTVGLLTPSKPSSDGRGYCPSSPPLEPGYGVIRLNLRIVTFSILTSDVGHSPRSYRWSRFAVDNVESISHSLPNCVNSVAADNRRA
jgi:hypothetical protein